MIRIKICGVTNGDDAQAAVEAGADALGFIFYPPSPRNVTPERVAAITADLPPFVVCVGVFVNETVERIRQVTRLAGLHAAQLHGEETPTFCEELGGTVIKAFRLKDASWRDDAARYRVRAALLDTYVEGQRGGTGRTFDWSLACSEQHRVILSGGLNPDNVRTAIDQARPYGVDVGSGVEKSPGVKDHARIKGFVKAARHAL
jgi:phosphoribosylanthranilate isomerase